jgi:hypothetical protein
MEQTPLCAPVKLGPAEMPARLPDATIRMLWGLVEKYGLTSVILGLASACRSKGEFTQDRSEERAWTERSLYLEVISRDIERNEICHNDLQGESL